MRLLVLIIAIIIWQNTPVYAEAEPDYNKLIQAIYKAEGGRRASVPYGIMWKGCDWENEGLCKRIALNTVKNQWKRHKRHAAGHGYFDCLAERYAPTQGATNDPTGLNKHWRGNVGAIYAKLVG